MAREARRKKFRLFTGRESAAGENFDDFRAISEGGMVKKGYFGGFLELRFFVNNSTDFFKISDFL